MADLTPQERLQPALLDRLVDAVPTNRTKEPRDQRVLNKARMRQAVLRDLAWLFNATRPAARDGLGGYRHTERSVLNFGLPPFSGVTASSLDIIALEQAIRQTILDFEPRIIASSLEVVPIVTELALDHHNVISIQIHGMLWAQPVPLELLLRTDVDLETGEVHIRDMARSG